MINLKNYEYLTEVKSLLAECMMAGSDKIEQELLKYSEEDSRILFGRLINNELVGLVGIIQISAAEVELKHIAVKSEFKNQGIGRKMILEYLQNSRTVKMIAETDKDAVNFYRKIGFEITSLGEKYPGVERFKCILSVSQGERNFT
ncbi:hypothetical protein PCCS19_02250 [Paenibacillus sp. CCS19]|uniref:GNAT family N-acetyltransferase n=1 Tax=Paenibacillus sp. CCS19 TaxID=3158387 RepID=UPI002563D261|nr:GNAT family N-acetyltransferase [Paenibacillus cellulosilyticus]GMK37172.1 hypothetical protein PCCS19_02250 [Paenibacillus cellulosilyticus]